MHFYMPTAGTMYPLLCDIYGYMVRGIVACTAEGQWEVGLSMVGKWLVSGCRRKLWSSPCFQHPGRCTWQDLLTCSFLCTGSYIGCITPLWVHQLLLSPQGEWRQEPDSCAGCWELTAVRNLLCNWMPEARSREYNACRTTEKMQSVENKDPERARNRSSSRFSMKGIFLWWISWCMRLQEAELRQSRKDMLVAKHQEIQHFLKLS